MVRLFVPGWGAPPSLYRVPAGWSVLTPPRFAAASTLEARLRWLRAELERYDGPVVLAGHSMGAALAVLVAADSPQRIERLLLLSPAGLPLAKPMQASVRDFAQQLRTRLYPREQAVRAVGAVLAAPRPAFRLAAAVRRLDLREQLASLDVRAVVVGCTTDTLTPPSHCRRIAKLGRAGYREVDLPGGHMWMLGDRRAFAAALTA
jgi:pimeloyl-ACP methyl ester carboxylesterase